MFLIKSIYSILIDKRVLSLTFEKLRKSQNLDSGCIIEGCCVKSGVFAFPRCVFTLSALFLYQMLLFKIKVNFLKIKVTDHGRPFLDLGSLFDRSNHL